MSVHYIRGLSAQHHSSVSKGRQAITVGVGSVGLRPPLGQAHQSWAIQRQIVQPFAMVSGNMWVVLATKTCRKNQTRGHSVGIAWQFEAQKKCAFADMASSSESVFNNSSDSRQIYCTRQTPKRRLQEPHT